MPRNKSKVLFIVKGGRNYGMGHLVRAGILIETFAPFFGISVLVNGDTYAKNLFRNRKIKFSTYSGTSDLLQFIKKNGSYAFIIVDMLHISVALLKNIEKYCRYLIVFDDMQKLTRRRIRGFVICPQETSRSSIERKGGRYSIKGADFFPLRQKFLFYRKRKAFSPSVKNILVCLGGGTEPARTLRLVKLLDGCIDESIKLHAVIGYVPGETNKHKFSKRVIFYNTVDNPARLISRADIGIISSGFIKFEFMCIGTPFCLVSLNSHQGILAKKYSSRGYGFYAGNIKDIEARPKVFCKKIAMFIVSGSLREKMFIRARSLIDGRGDLRILNLSQRLLKKGRI